MLKYTLCSKSKQFRSVLGKFLRPNSLRLIFYSPNKYIFHFFMWPYLGILCTFLHTMRGRYFFAEFWMMRAFRPREDYGYVCLWRYFSFSSNEAKTEIIHDSAFTRAKKNPNKETGLGNMGTSKKGTFEPVHKIQKNFWPKVFFWSIMKMSIRKIFHNMSQGPPNSGFMQEKVQKGDFLKKGSRELKNYFCFRFLWIPRTPGRVN